MTKTEIFDAIAKLRFTPQGVAERLRLLALVPDDLGDEDLEDGSGEPKSKNKKPLRAREPNWYHGLSRRDLVRWVALREAGLVADLAWWRRDPATGIRLRMLRAVTPMQCRPVPDDYTGKLHNKGMW